MAFGPFRKTADLSVLTDDELRELLMALTRNSTPWLGHTERRRKAAGKALERYRNRQILLLSDIPLALECLEAYRLNLQNADEPKEMYAQTISDVISAQKKLREQMPPQ